MPNIGIAFSFLNTNQLDAITSKLERIGSLAGRAGEIARGGFSPGSLPDTHVVDRLGNIHEKQTGRFAGNVYQMSRPNPVLGFASGVGQTLGFAGVAGSVGGAVWGAREATKQSSDFETLQKGADLATTSIRQLRLELNNIGNAYGVTTQQVTQFSQALVASGSYQNRSGVLKQDVGALAALNVNGLMSTQAGTQWQTSANLVGGTISQQSIQAMLAGVMQGSQTWGRGTEIAGAVSRMAEQLTLQGGGQPGAYNQVLPQLMGQTQALGATGVPGLQGQYGVQQLGAMNQDASQGTLLERGELLNYLTKKLGRTPTQWEIIKAQSQGMALPGYLEFVTQDVNKRAGGNTEAAALYFNQAFPSVNPNNVEDILKAGPNAAPVTQGQNILAGGGGGISGVNPSQTGAYMKALMTGDTATQQQILAQGPNKVDLGRGQSVLQTEVEAFQNDFVKAGDALLPELKSVANTMHGLNRVTNTITHELEGIGGMIGYLAAGSSLALVGGQFAGTLLGGLRGAKIGSAASIAFGDFVPDTAAAGGAAAAAAGGGGAASLVAGEGGGGILGVVGLGALAKGAGGKVRGLFGRGAAAEEVGTAGTAATGTAVATSTVAQGGGLLSRLGGVAATGAIALPAGMLTSGLVGGAEGMVGVGNTGAGGVFKNVTSLAAGGAIAGTMFAPGIGTLIGAGGGALLGLGQSALGGLFGGGGGGGGPKGTTTDPLVTRLDTLAPYLNSLPVTLDDADIQKLLNGGFNGAPGATTLNKPGQAPAKPPDAKSTALSPDELRTAEGEAMSPEHKKAAAAQQKQDDEAKQRKQWFSAIDQHRFVIGAERVQELYKSDKPDVDPATGKPYKVMNYAGKRYEDIGQATDEQRYYWPLPTGQDQMIFPDVLQQEFQEQYRKTHGGKPPAATHDPTLMPPSTDKNGGAAQPQSAAGPFTHTDTKLDWHGRAAFSPLGTAGQNTYGMPGESVSAVQQLRVQDLVVEGGRSLLDTNGKPIPVSLTSASAQELANRQAAAQKHTGTAVGAAAGGTSTGVHTPLPGGAGSHTNVTGTSISAQTNSWAQQHASELGMSSDTLAAILNASSYYETKQQDTNEVGSEGPFSFDASGPTQNNYGAAVRAGFNPHTVNGSLDAFTQSGDMSLGLAAYKQAVAAGASPEEAAHAFYQAMERPNAGVDATRTASGEWHQAWSIGQQQAAAGATTPPTGTTQNSQTGTTPPRQAGDTARMQYQNVQDKLGNPQYLSQGSTQRMANAISVRVTGSVTVNWPGGSADVPLRPDSGNGYDDAQTKAAPWTV